MSADFKAISQLLRNKKDFSISGLGRVFTLYVGDRSYTPAEFAIFLGSLAGYKYTGLELAHGAAARMVNILIEEERENMKNAKKQEQEELKRVEQEAKLAELRQQKLDALPEELRFISGYRSDNTALFQAVNQPEALNKYILETPSLKVIPIYAESFLETLGTRKQPGTPSEYDSYLEASLTGHVVYKPTSKNASCVYEAVGFNYEKILELNCYVRPKYQTYTKYVNRKVARLPGLLDRFFKHLIPDEHEREILFDKLHHIVKSRCQTYLVLSGSRGTGKTTIGKIMILVLGANNARMAPTRFVESTFNSVLKHNRLLVMDEFEANTYTKIDYLKEIINDRVTINTKFVNAREEIENFNSFILLNNDYERIAVMHNDRRFFFFTVTDLPLTNAFSKEEITELTSLNEDSQSILEFGTFLHQRKPVIDIDSNYIEKTPRFMAAVYGALSGWQKFILEQFVDFRLERMSYEEFVKKMQKINKASAKYMPTVKTVGNFLRDYRHGVDGLQVGKVVAQKQDDGGRKYFIVNKYTEEFKKFKGGNNGTGIGDSEKKERVNSVTVRPNASVNLSGVQREVFNKSAQGSANQSYT